MSQTHPSRWEALTEVARRCVAEKQFDKAEEAFLAALREAEQFGDSDPRIVATLNALARVYHRRSKFFPAAALLHRLLGIKEREHGEEHPELAGILNNLAEMYSRLGDARQELELRERALRIRTNSGESEGGALDALRVRIAELRQKLQEERAREEAARNAPAPRIPVPSGVTDLPLILPTAAPSPQLSALPAAFATPRKAEPVPGRATPANAAVADPIEPLRPSPGPMRAADMLPGITTTPIGSASAAPIQVGKPLPKHEPAEHERAGEPKWTPLVPRALDSTRTPPAPAPSDAKWKPLAPVAPDSTWKPLAPAAPDSTWKPLAPAAPDSTWKPLEPPAPDSTRTPLALPAPGAFRGPKASPVPESPWKPIAAPAPDTTWKPLAPPAPSTSWSSHHDAAADAEPGPSPDDYDAPLEYAARRNLKPFAMGGLALAATVAIAIFVFGRSDTGSSSSGAVEAQAPATRAAERPVAPAPQTPGEAAALRAGLANLQQETDPIPPQTYAPDGSFATQSPATVEGPRRNADSIERPLPRVSVPSAVLDKVTSSIEAAARARVDSLTQVTDKQVVEYTGKKPRQ